MSYDFWISQVYIFQVSQEGKVYDYRRNLPAKCIGYTDKYILTLNQKYIVWLKLIGRADS